MTPARLAEIRGRWSKTKPCGEYTGLSDTDICASCGWSLHCHDIRDLLLALDAATAEISTAREACPAVRMQDFADASLLTLVNEQVSQLFRMQSRAETAESARDAALARAEAAEQQVEVLQLGGMFAWKDKYEKLRALTTWQPIESCPPEVTRAMVYWPTFALNDDCEQTEERKGDGLVAEAFRVGRNQWESDIVTEHFEDEAGFGYGEPTHWQPLPLPPATTEEEGA